MDFNPNHCQSHSCDKQICAEFMCPVLACQALNPIITWPTVTEVFTAYYAYLKTPRPRQIFLLVFLYPFLSSTPFLQIVLLNW